MSDGTPDGALPLLAGPGQGAIGSGSAVSGTGALTGAPIEHERLILPDEDGHVTSPVGHPRGWRFDRTPGRAPSPIPSVARHGRTRSSNAPAWNAWRST